MVEASVGVLLLGGFAVLCSYVLSRDVSDGKQFIAEICKPWPNHVEEAIAHRLAFVIALDAQIAEYVRSNNALDPEVKILQSQAVDRRTEVERLIALARTFSINVSEDRISTLARERAKHWREYV